MATNFQLRILLPVLVILAFCLDIGLRFVVPPERLAFRLWEPAMHLFPASDGPFRPGISLEKARSSGDVANMTNLPRLREFHRERFSTDESGFRKTPASLGREVRIVVFGDSFAAGAALSDDETLSAALASLSGLGVFNAGEVTGAGVQRTVRTLFPRLKLDKGLVVYVQSERFEFPSRRSLALRSMVTEEIATRWPAAYNSLLHVYRTGNAFSTYSPLEVVLTQRFKALRDDVILPNTAATQAPRRTLRNGRELLFLKSEPVNFERSRNNVEATYFVELRSMLASRGCQLLVVLVPDKYNTYYPLFSNPIEEPKREPYLSVAARVLDRSGVPVLDLTSVLRQQAAELLDRGEYNYWTDDTHWNSNGVRRAAQAILEKWGLWRPPRMTQ
jgi:hypothetical protein